MSEEKKLTKKEWGELKKQLTVEQVLFLRAMQKGKTSQEAYIAAGYDGDFSAQGGRKMLRTIQKKMPEILDAFGITQERIAKKLDSLLEATEVKVFYDSKTGKVVYSDPLPALDIQLRTTDVTNKMRGNYIQPEDLQRQQAPTQIMVVVKNVWDDEEMKVGVEVN
jgi:hypothetical protein